MVSLESKLEKITWQILNLLFEEENTFFLNSVPESTSPAQPQGSHRIKHSAFFYFPFFFLTFWT